MMAMTEEDLRAARREWAVPGCTVNVTTGLQYYAERLSRWRGELDCGYGDTMIQTS